MISVVVNTKRGHQITVTNADWNSFLLSLLLCRAIVAEGVYVPIEEIDSVIPPSQPGGALAPPIAKTMAEVLHLVPRPNPEPPGAA